MQQVHSYIAGAWLPPDDSARDIAHAITGQVIARAGRAEVDADALLSFARAKGAPALRALSFHQRARLLKALATYLNARKDQLYAASFATGATARDHLLDVDGGIGTLFVYASKGRRELPDSTVLCDGAAEPLGKTGAFQGQHVYTSRPGVMVQINAFNFPVWGMLEKLAPALLAGLPCIVKPATVTCYVTELCVRMMLDSGLLPEGALQLVAGSLGDSLQALGAQDCVAFTGSAATAAQLRAPVEASGAAFAAEQDSLNASILAPDAEHGAPEFDLFIKEAAREMTVKAGQKCTATRRLLVPVAQADAVIAALSAQLSKVTVGDPQAEGVRMGALVSTAQRRDVLDRAEILATEAEQVFGGQHNLSVIGADAEAGAFVAPTLFHCTDPDAATRVHALEAFGPVSTVLGYRDIGHAVTLANRGQGSLVASVFTRDPEVARYVVAEAGAWHGRIYFNNRDSAPEATGHGAPMPHMVHGGPGRAGGGEELGGIRAVKHLMQRTAVQGSPDLLTAIGGTYLPGARTEITKSHPFTRRFSDLQIGQTLRTPAREVTLDDIEHFAHFTGDTFYAHMDEAAARRNPFFPGRVAHGYLLLSFAAGLFVEPNEGPVLANTGLDGLRFLKPVSPGDSIAVDLTVMAKTPRSSDYGEVRWHVRLTNQDGDAVAEYQLLTMVSDQGD